MQSKPRRHPLSIASIRGKTVAGRPCTTRGFTLIELMIAVAVVGILVAIAVPSYQDSVRKSRRGQAKSDLVQVAQMFERYRTVNATYATPSSLPTTSPFNGIAYYTLATANVTGTTFTVTATPITATGQNQDACGTLAINQAGVKMHSTGTDAACQFGTTGP